MRIIEMIKNLEIGDTFYETGYGLMELEVLTKPSNNDGAWTWTALDINDKDRGAIDYLVNEKYLAYAPKICL